MFSFIRLVKIECMKIFQKKISIFMIVILLISLSFAAYMKLDTGHGFLNWENQTEQRIVMANQSLEIESATEARVKLQEQILISQYRIENNIAPLLQDTFWGFVIYASSFIGMATIISLIIAGGIVSNEFSAGTIKLLLIRPHSRSTILRSKYIASLLYGLVVVSSLLVYALLIGFVFLDTSQFSTSHLSVSNGVVQESSIWIHVFIIYLLNSVGLLMLVTFAFMLSTAIRSSTFAIGASLLLALTGSIAIELMKVAGFTWAKFLLFANTNLLQYTMGEPPFEGMTYSFSLIVLVVYYIAFILIAWLSFTKRDVSI